MASRSHRKVHMGRFLSAAVAGVVLLVGTRQAQAQEATPAQPAPTTEGLIDQDSGGGMNSPGAFGVGIVLTSAGAVGLGVGGWLFSKGAGACDSITGESIPSDAEIDACTSGVTNQVAGVLTMVAGGAFALAGIPLIITGAIPAEREDQPAPRIAVNVGPTNATLAIEF